MTMLCGEALPLPDCPNCGGQDTLLPLGCRHDRPQRWRPWVVVVTELYLCDRCAAIVRAPAAAQRPPVWPRPRPRPARWAA